MSFKLIMRVLERQLAGIGARPQPIKLLLC